MRLLTLPPMLRRAPASGVPAAGSTTPGSPGRSGPAGNEAAAGPKPASRGASGMAAAAGRSAQQPGAKSRRKTPIRRRRPLPRWLRRSLLRGLPLLLLLSLIGGFVWAHRDLDTAGILAAARDQLVASTTLAGFSVQDIEVEGRDLTLAATVVHALDAGRGSPILSFSPSRAKQALERLPWVRAAIVERIFPSTIYVRLLERKPLAIWQDKGRMSLIDREGQVVTSEGLERFPGLVLLVGDRAPAHAAELLAMLGSETELGKRVSSAIWVGDRRWSIRLDSGVAVELPEENAAAAWKQLALADRAGNLLGRDVVAIDLRFGDRLVVRVNGEWPKKPAPKGRPA